MTPEELEQLKLEDGVRIHENTKVELEVYARENGQDPSSSRSCWSWRGTPTHANALQQVIEGDAVLRGPLQGQGHPGSLQHRRRGERTRWSSSS